MFSGIWANNGILASFGDPHPKLRDLAAIEIHLAAKLVRQNSLPPPQHPDVGRSREGNGRYDYHVFPIERTFTALNDIACAVNAEV